MSTDNTSKILARCDRGESVAEIAEAVGLTPGRIYTILRTHRPKRKRKERERTSDMPRKVLALANRGTKPRRISELLGITRTYVYKILCEQG